MTQRHAAPALHIWDSHWDLWVAECPCDVHFIGWLDASGTSGKTIYHFGTGAHHVVGLEATTPERGHAVLGITASPAEYEAFVKLATARPDVLRNYNVTFGDIYLLNARLLPDLDVATLFHLCEFRGPENDAYGAMTDLELTMLLTDRLRAGGHVLFYSGSFAFDAAQRVIAAWERQRDVVRVGTHESLVVYRKLS